MSSTDFIEDETVLRQTAALLMIGRTGANSDNIRNIYRDTIAFVIESFCDDNELRRFKRDIRRKDVLLQPLVKDHKPDSSGITHYPDFVNRFQLPADCPTGNFGFGDGLNGIFSPFELMLNSTIRGAFIPDYPTRYYFQNIWFWYLYYYPVGQLYRKDGDTIIAAGDKILLRYVSNNVNEFLESANKIVKRYIGCLIAENSLGKVEQSLLPLMINKIEHTKNTLIQTAAVDANNY